MKPSELYARTPDSVSTDLTYLHPSMGCNHIPEIDWQLINYADQIARNKRIKIKIYKDHDFDGRRFWRVGAAFFDGEPVMAFQNAGREGDDNHQAFITHLKLYNEMVNYLRSLYSPITKEDVSVYYEDEEIPALANFYNSHIDDFK